MSGPVVEDPVVTEIPTTKTVDTEADDQPGEIIEDPYAVVSFVEEADDTQIDSQSGEVSEVAEEAEKPADEAGGLQAEEEQTDNVVKTEDPDTAESISQEREDAQTGKLTDDVSGPVVEDSVAADVEETIIEGPADESQTIVDRIKKVFSGIFRIVSKADNSTEKVVETPDDKIQTAVFYDNKSYRTKKTAVIISVFIVIAALILLSVASIERRSARKSLAQIRKASDSIKQMHEETLIAREQITRSQIEGREMVIDALSLTRSGLELERVNAGEIEVKRIITVFINDIDERISKIKGDIVLLRNKLKQTN